LEESTGKALFLISKPIGKMARPITDKKKNIERERSGWTGNLK